MISVVIRRHINGKQQKRRDRTQDRVGVSQTHKLIELPFEELHPFVWEVNEVPSVETNLKNIKQIGCHPLRLPQLFGFQDMAALDITALEIKVKDLHFPPLDELAQVLSKGLRSTFETVEVEVLDCPDLTQPPFTLAAQGFGGKTQIVDLGGASYLMPLVQRNKVYDLKSLLKHLKRDPGYIAGAGAGPWPFLGVNCEGIINLSLKDGEVNQGSSILTVVPHHASKADGKHKLVMLPPTETRCALLGNYVLSDGKPGKVVKVVCKKRIGEDNYITAIRETLKSHYKEKVVGLGGTFLLKEGKSKQHVMPDFSKTPIETEEQVNEWLHFFEMEAPLIHLGTLITGDLDLDLRVEHFHSFSHHGDGGHYHYDTTPETAEYLGYFAVGETVMRVDAPTKTRD